MLNSIIAISQIAVAVLLIALILLQERSSGSSGLWGGVGGDGGFYQVRRGLERAIFVSTIVLTIVFVGLSLANLIV